VVGHGAHNPRGSSRHLQGGEEEEEEEEEDEDENEDEGEEEDGGGSCEPAGRRFPPPPCGCHEAESGCGEGCREDGIAVVVEHGGGGKVRVSGG
jgi:hypothetical protein